MRRANKLVKLGGGLLALVAGAAGCLVGGAQVNQEDGIVLSFDEERVIGYSRSSDLADPVAKLFRRVAQGKERLIFDPEKGYLPDILNKLKVPVSSQTLVFSKTSAQAPHTSPATPRAIYFSDSVFVGWAKGSHRLDLAAIDPQKGPVFYSLDQTEVASPAPSRDIQCLSCHIGSKTLDVPGLVIRSVFTEPDGKATAMLDGFVSGHNNTLRDRWGGWYVTGTHGEDVHLGNRFLRESQHRGADLKASSNLTSLKGLLDTSLYLSPHSDTVALLVLDHAVRMHTYFTKARYEALLAQDSRRTKPGDPVTATWADRRMKEAAEELVAYMLFRDEARLHGPIHGTSSYQAEFVTQGPKDSRGRSLREFDLVARVFKYPCSYLVYSEAFDAIPDEMKGRVWSRLAAVLTGRERSGLYATMTDPDRRAVLEILRDTKPDFRRWLAAHPLS